jgi:hypothetical protein
LLSSGKNEKSLASHEVGSGLGKKNTLPFLAEYLFRVWLFYDC